MGKWCGVIRHPGLSFSGLCSLQRYTSSPHIAPPAPFTLGLASRSEGFGTEVKRRIMLGTFALSSGYYDAYYLKALKVRQLIKQDFDEAFKLVDVIASPTSPIPAFKMGEKIDDPLQMYLCDVFTVNINLAGIPGISIPCGFTKEDLPVGFQILGQPFDEARLLQVARAFERETDYHKKKPNINPVVAPHQG